MLLTAYQILKATRLHESGSVREQPAARVFEVGGDTGTYLVVFHGDDMTCTCPHQGTCAHLAAVGLQVRAEG